MFRVTVSRFSRVSVSDSVRVSYRSGVSATKGKSKVFPYSLPSVGPAADPGVQAVSPQVT